MKTEKIKALLLGLAAAGSLVACQGGRDVESAVGGLDHGYRSEQGVGGISAWVDGGRYQFNGDKRYTVAAGETRSLKVVSLDSDDSHWALQNLSPRAGRYRCAEDGLQIEFELAGQMSLSSRQGGDCQIDVSEAGYRYLRGRFAGSLTDASGRRYAIEKGEFDIELAAAIPDLDGDGLSDADDNCPFDANPDQADADGNLIGDACEASDEG